MKRFSANGISWFSGSSVRTGIAATLRLAPVSFWRRLFPKSAVGICYHVVSDTKLPHLKHYRRLTISEFEVDLDYLQRTFGFIGYDELERRRSSQGAVRDNSVILTFDDGFAECANIVAPLLRKRGLGGVFFVIADLIDNALMFRENLASLCIDLILKTSVDQVGGLVRELGIDAQLCAPPRGASEATRAPLDMADLGARADPRLQPLLQWLLTIEPGDDSLLALLAVRLGVNADAYLREAQPYMTASQIRALRHDGFTIGAHSRSHRLLQKLSRNEAAREIVDSCRIIRDLTGQRQGSLRFSLCRRRPKQNLARRASPSERIYRPFLRYRRPARGRRLRRSEGLRRTDRVRPHVGRRSAARVGPEECVEAGRLIRPRQTLADSYLDLISLPVANAPDVELPGSALAAMFRD